MSVANVSSPIHFQAKWTTENSHLKETNLLARIWKAVKEFFKTIFCCCIKTITHRLVLPAAYVKKEWKNDIEYEWKNLWFGPFSDENPLKQNFSPIPLQVKTPAGNTISGVFYQHKKGIGQDIPTILCFNGNAQHSKAGTGYWLLELARECNVPFNVAVFDYPSCAASNGKIHEDQLVLAGDSMYQCIQDEFKISDENIHMIGQSLGGGVSAKLMAAHPKAGRYVNSHSFKSLKKLILETTMVDIIRDVFFPKVAKCLVSAKCARKVAASSVESFFGNLNSEEALAKIKNKTLIVYHQKDPLIQDACLAYADAGKVKEVLSLKDRSYFDFTNHHVEPYEKYVDEEGLPANKRILNFLLGREVFAISQRTAG